MEKNPKPRKNQCKKTLNCPPINFQLLADIDPPGPGRIGGHFHTWCPYVRHTYYNAKQNTLQRYMGPGGSLNLILTRTDLSISILRSPVIMRGEVRLPGLVILNTWVITGFKFYVEDVLCFQCFDSLHLTVARPIFLP